MSSSAKMLIAGVLAFALGFLANGMLTRKEKGPGSGELTWESEGETLRLQAPSGGFLLALGGDSHVEPESDALIVGREDSFVYGSVMKWQEGRLKPVVPCIPPNQIPGCTPVEPDGLVSCFETDTPKLICKVIPQSPPIVPPAPSPFLKGESPHQG